MRSTPLTRLAPIALAGSLVAAFSEAGAVSYYLAVDVPARLGSVEVAAGQAALSQGGSYSIEVSLPAGVEIGALHRRPDGTWLLGLAHPATIGGATYEGRDLVAYDGASWSLWFDGSASGIPEGARIDALFLDAAGAAVLSLDVPATVLGMEIGPSDLVRHEGGLFSRYWSGAAAGVPAQVNLVGADLDSAGALVLSFDVPASMGGAYYLPGQLVRWTGTGFASHFVDGSWPPYAQLRDFTFVPAAGAVPDGSSLPGAPLTIFRAETSLTLSWNPSCAAGDGDYEVYEGILGRYYSHAPRLCSTEGATAITFPAPAGSAYYLVVPRNAVREGSYGLASTGAERPPGSGACLPREISEGC